MSTRTFPHKLMAMGLGLLLISCSTARPMTAAVAATGGGALILVPLVVMAENSPGALPATQFAESIR